ncbi:MASE1 domain-containing protein [Lysobacter cavernae]|uniref:MASE1 domain-containing protein n=1 Tax=Lysobacter cavernae TaxID=1685901 RepID=A0ABV7RIH9_9GAMM
MEVGSWKSVLKGMCLSVIYGFLMLGAWRLSVDQWYLPAGIRVAALLLLPTRLWPYIFAGDAAAFLFLRAPKAEQYSEQWAYLSPFLLAPLVAVVPAISRRLLGDISDHERWFPAVALAIAVWTALVNMSINLVLSGPAASNTLENFLRYVVGQYLGIFIFVPVLMVWRRRNDGMSCPRRLLAHSAIATGLTAVMYLAANLGDSEPALRQMLLLLMIAPAVALTFLHGWRGASVGVAVASVAYGLPTTAFDTAGAHDAVTFIAQQTLAIATTALFVFGSVISAHFDRARKLGVAERHALKIAQSTFLSTERHLRDRVLAMAQIQAHLDESRQAMIRWLEDMGHSAAVLDLKRSGQKDTQLFDEHADALYPMRIEQQGLYDVLQSPAFSSVWAGGADVRFQLRGKARALPVDLQLAAYRCACNAVALLSQGRPIRQTVRARAWAYKGQRGIVVTVNACGGRDVKPSQTSMLASLELEGRVKTHGGAMKRRHVNQVSFLLIESSDTTSAPQRVDAGPTVHQSLLLV